LRALKKRPEGKGSDLQTSQGLEDWQPLEEPSATAT